MAYMQINANNNLNTLDVVIMMWMAFASFRQFLLEVDMSVMRTFVTVVEREGCHGDETKMMPRQHSDDLVAHGDTGEKGSGCECVMQEDGVLPDTGFPHIDGKATRNSQRTTRTRCNHEHLIHHTTFIHGRRLGGYTFQGSILKWLEFVEEEVVLVTIV